MRTTYRSAVDREYACPYVAICNPCLFIFDLNLLSFKFELYVQNVFKFKTNSYLNLTFDLILSKFNLNFSAKFI